MKIWVDGGGWNGKESKWCIAFEDGRILKESIKEKRTNNEMEYFALIKALEMCNKGDVIYSDSQLVVGQVTKGWKVTKEHLFPLVMKAKRLATEKEVTIQWIPREENYAGHLLEG